MCGNDTQEEFRRSPGADEEPLNRDSGRRSTATALLAAWGNTELLVGLLSVVKSYLFVGGLLEGTNLVHRYSRSHFQWVCTTAKYKESKNTESLSFSEVLVAARDFVLTSHFSVNRMFIMSVPVLGCFSYFLSVYKIQAIIVLLFFLLKVTCSARQL